MDSTITIYNPWGNEKLNVIPESDSSRVFQLMQSDHVSLKFKTIQPIHFLAGDYIVIEGEGRYELLEPYSPQAERGICVYDMMFHAQYRKFANKLMKFIPTAGASETSWSYTGHIADFAAQVINNMNALAYDYTKGELIEENIAGVIKPIWKPEIRNANYLWFGEDEWTFEINLEDIYDGDKVKTLTFNSTNILDAITQIAEEYDCEWWFEDSVLKFGHMSRQCFTDDPNSRVGVIEEGVEIVNTDCQRNNEKFANRVYAFGGSRNLPSTYRKELLFNIDEAYDGTINDSTRPIQAEWLRDVKKYADTRYGMTGEFRNVYTNPTKQEINYGQIISAGAEFKGEALKYEVFGDLVTPVTLMDTISYTIVFGKMSASYLPFEGSPTHKIKIFTEATFKLVDGSYERVAHTKEIYITRTDTNHSIKPDDFSYKTKVAAESVWINYSVYLEVLDGNIQRVKASWYVNAESTNAILLTSYPEWQVDDIVLHFFDGVTGEPLNLYPAQSEPNRIDGVIYNVAPAYQHKFYLGRHLPAELKPGVKFTIKQINKALVPADRFTSKYAAFEKYADITTSGIVVKELCLPETDEYGNPLNGYIDLDELLPNEPDDKIVESVVRFEDVYPQRTTSVKSIEEEEGRTETPEQDGSTAYKTWPIFVIEDAWFDDNNPFDMDYLLPNQDLQITFQSGLLTGMTYDVEYRPIENRFVIKRDDTTETPSEYLRPNIGDEYILSGFDISMLSDNHADYIGNAERMLLEKTRRYIEKVKRESNTYRCTIGCDYAYQAYINNPQEYPESLYLKAGDLVRFIHPIYAPDGEPKRVMGYEVPLLEPYNNPIYILGEKPEYSRLGTLEGKVDKLQIKSGILQSGVTLSERNSGLTASQVKGWIRSVGANHFISKKDNDTANGLVDFQKGLYLKGFVPGVSGGALINVNGESYIEVDRLKVRKKAKFENLEIVNVKSVGGKLIVSPGDGFVVIKVEEVIDRAELIGYKCYFKAEQEGEVVTSRFTVGDCAFSQTFNLIDNEGGVQIRCWWRRVDDIGEDYILVSNTDYDPNNHDIPKVGDSVVQLGSRNEARSSAIVISTTDVDSPMMYLYHGINNFNLENTEQIGMGVRDGKPYLHVYGSAFMGDRIEQLQDREDGKGYLRYSPENGLEIKGGISTRSSVGGMPIADYISNEVEGQIGDISYLTNAIKNGRTLVNGGLVLSTLLRLGTWPDGMSHTTFSGLSGIYDTTKPGNGIAFWAGGDMNDYAQYYEWDDQYKRWRLKGGYTESNADGVLVVEDGNHNSFRIASAVDRMDGSGYRALGNLFWDKNGHVYADPSSFIVGGVSTDFVVGLFNYYKTLGQYHTEAENFNDCGYVLPTRPFEEIRIGESMENSVAIKYDKVNNALYVENCNPGMDSVGFYSRGWLSSMGIGAISGAVGGTSTLDEEEMWRLLGTNTTQKEINSIHLHQVINPLILENEDMPDSEVIGTYYPTSSTTINISPTRLGAVKVSGDTMSGVLKIIPTNANFTADRPLGLWGANIGIQLERADHIGIQYKCGDYVFGSSLNSTGNIALWGGTYDAKTLLLGMSTTNGVKIGVGTNAPDSTLHVVGDIKAHNIVASGYITAYGSVSSSDERMKDVLHSIELSVEDVAAAPIVAYTWKGTGEKDFGTLAQYWQNITPLAVKEDTQGMLAVDYGKLGLVSAVSVAKKTKELEARILKLEEEILLLRNELLKK